MEILNKVIATLNNVEVHGKNNLDMLLGSIIALEVLKGQIAKEEKAKVSTEVDSDV